MGGVIYNYDSNRIGIVDGNAFKMNVLKQHKKLASLNVKAEQCLTRRSKNSWKANKETELKLRLNSWMQTQKLIG